MSERVFRIKLSRVASPARVLPSEWVDAILPDAWAMSDEPRIRKPKPPSPGLTASVIGPENRQRVMATDKFPFSPICHLLILDNAGKPVAMGTGWFVSRHVVITAAHVVAPIRNGSPVKPPAIAVIPGRNGSDNPFGHSIAKRFDFAPKWAAPATRNENDYGAIFLDDPLGDKPGSVDPGVFPDNVVPQLNVNLTGYPADPPGTAGAGTMWGTAGKVQLLAPNGPIFRYGIDMTQGQSGSPLLVKTQTGSILAVGINTAELLDSNEGVRITAPVAQQISLWAGAS